jgi:hypothetical protein
MRRIFRACALLLALTLIVGSVGSVSLSASMMPGPAAAMADVSGDMSQCPDCIDPGMAEATCESGCAVTAAVLAMAPESKQARPGIAIMAAISSGVGRLQQPEPHPPK